MHQFSWLLIQLNVTDLSRKSSELVNFCLFVCFSVMFCTIIVYMCVCELKVGGWMLSCFTSVSNVQSCEIESIHRTPCIPVKTKYILSGSIGIKRVRCSQELLMNYTWLIHHCEYRYKSRSFDSLLVWSFQVCIYAIPQSFQQWAFQQIHPKVRQRSHIYMQ